MGEEPLPDGVTAKTDQEVEVGKEEAGQVGQVGYPHAARKLAEKFNTGIDHDQDDRANREDPENQDPGIRVEGRKAEEYRVDRPGGANQGDLPLSQHAVEDQREDSGKEAGQKVVEKEFPTPRGPFNLGTEEKEGQHIEEDVANACVHKHIGEGLPDKARTDKRGVHAKVDPDNGEEFGEEVDRQVQHNQDQGHVEEGIPEGPPDGLQ